MDHRDRAAGGWLRTDRPGIALLVVMLVTLMVGAIAAGAALIGANTFLINEYDQKLSLLESAADGGLELARARLNADPGLYNDTAVVTLEVNAAVDDAHGAAIPGVRRTVYAMPVGGGAGEHGNFAAVISMAEDGSGARVVRRLDLLQESLATFAYFTDFEGATIFFLNNDQLFGRVHSNADIKIHSTRATFHGLTTTSSVFQGAQYGTFHDDTISGVPRIPFPGASSLNRLESRAAPANLALAAPTGGGANQAEARIEFVSRALGDPDGPRTGFIKVYAAPGAAWWVTGNPNPHAAGMLRTRSCGNFNNGVFQSFAGNNWQADSAQAAALRTSSRRCYLGGTDSIWGGNFQATDNWGQWLPWQGDPIPEVAGQPDAAFLWPIDRALNDAFRGVIFVDGKVVVSGTVRGRVTLAATGNIIIGDDLVYDTDPGAGTCRDILGLFSGQRVVVADNMLNAPRRATSGDPFRTYDDTRDVHIHATILALDQFTVENFNAGSQDAEPCNGTAVGRGCLYVNGGIIQRTRGPVGTLTGFGHLKQYSFDQCVFTNPPPYFPSTGHFWAGRYYEIDPTGFDIGAYYNTLN